MEIYLARHTSVDVPRGTAYGQTDVPLRDTFAEEAEEVKRQLDGRTFDAVYTSPLTRCVRLASYCGYPDAVPDSRLLELDFGEWEMKTWDEIQADPRSAAWWDDWIDTPAPRGESFRQQYARLAGFLQDIQRRGYRRVCLFAHGGILSAARIYTGEIPFREAFRQVLPYGTVLRIEI